MTQERPEDYERQLEYDRAAIGATIDAIQHRLSPGQLLDQALGYAKTSGSEVASTLVRSARRNPWPLVLTGVSLAWLMTSSSASQDGEAASRSVDRSSNGETPGYDAMAESGEMARYREMAERARVAAAAVQRETGEAEESFQDRVLEARARVLELKRGAEESVDAFRERVESGLRRAEEMVSDAGRRAGAAIHRGTDAVGAQARRVQEHMHGAQDRARQLYEAEPLVAGAIAVVAGTVLGALLPSTPVEQRLLGEQAGRIRREVEDRASTVADRAKAAAAEGLRAAVEAADDSVHDRQSHIPEKAASH
ncbi:MAG: DUF3618 domain-containing protein [Alphaproteobacteria bacterium]